MFDNYFRVDERQRVKIAPYSDNRVMHASSIFAEETELIYYFVAPMSFTVGFLLASS